MNHIEDRDEDVIELGVASIETKGPPILNQDQHGGNVGMGIAND